MRRGIAWPLYSTGFFSFSTGTITGLIIPLWALHLGATPLEIGLLVAAGHVGPLFLSLPIGSWCDRFGPRYVLLLSSVLATITAFAFPFFPAIWPIILLQTSFGVGRAAMWIASQAYLGTAVADAGASQYAYGQYSFFVNIGTFVGPAVVAVIIPTLSYTGGFAFLGLWCLACGLAAFLLPSLKGARGPYQNTRTATHNGLRLVGQAMALFVRPAIAFVLFATFIRLFSATVMHSFYPVYLIEGGYTESTIGLLIAVGNLAGAIITPFASSLSRLLGDRKALTLAMISSLVGVGATPILAVGGAWSLALGTAIEGAGRTVILPLLLPVLVGGVFPEERGLAFGVRVMVNRLASIIAPLLLGVISSWIPLGGSLIFCSAVMLVLTAVVVGYLRREDFSTATPAGYETGSA